MNLLHAPFAQDSLLFLRFGASGDLMSDRRMGDREIGSDQVIITSSLS